MKDSTNKDSLLLIFCAVLLIGVMLSARFQRGDFTRITYAHTAIPSNTENYVTEKDGRFFININRADKDALMLLDGIGEVMAQRIIDYREENGAFESVEELLEVKGIGEKTLEKIKPRIVCIPESTSESPLPERAPFSSGTLGGLFD